MIYDQVRNDAGGRSRLRGSRSFSGFKKDRKQFDRNFGTMGRPSKQA